MKPERFVERILETENLTDELEDSEARRLLNWGIARLDQLLQGIEDAEIAGERVNRLMALMRKLNRLAASLASARGGGPHRLEAELVQVDDLERALSPSAAPLDSQACRQAALKLAALEPGEAIDFLLAWIGAGQTSSRS